MAVKHIYFADDAGGGGDGSDSSPYNSLEAGIIADTHDATNGTQVNVKGAFTLGTDDLSGALADTSSTAAWVASRAAPIRFKGWDGVTVGGGGGVGEVDGDASYSIFNDNTQNWISFEAMKLGNVGNRFICDMNDNVAFLNCEIYGAEGLSANGLSLDFDAQVEGCYFHTIDGYGVLAQGNQLIQLNTFDYMGNYAIDNSGSDGFNLFNIIRCASAGIGIRMSGEGYYAHNAIWSNAGTGSGFVSAIAKTGAVLLNNVVEGFSGVGGIGYDLTNMSNVRLRAGNLDFNNETAVNIGPTEWMAIENATLAGSAFRDPANGDFSPSDLLIARMTSNGYAYPGGFKI